MAVDLDEVDVKLLTALQADADCTNVELARLVGLSPAATLHRVRRLKETGVIRVISAQLDPAACGFPLQVYVTATLSRHDPRSSRIFDDNIMALPQVIAAANAAGAPSADLRRPLSAPVRAVVRAVLPTSHRRARPPDPVALASGPGRAGRGAPGPAGRWSRPGRAAEDRRSSGVAAPTRATAARHSTPPLTSAAVPDVAPATRPPRM